MTPARETGATSGRTLGTIGGVDHDEPLDAVRRHHAQLGDDEWSRLTKDVKGRVSFEVHCQFLRRHVPEEARVREIGAGPGRFTTELAELGCQVVVTDLSPVQLSLNKERMGATAAERFVERRELLDVCDTSRYADGEFDAVLAYGGPLSYAFEQANAAMRGLLRVVKPDGVVVASVMSLLGPWRLLFTEVCEIAEVVGEDAADATLSTGDLRHVQPDGEVHICRMFRWSDVQALLERARGLLRDAGASNWASLADPVALARLEADPERWRRFLRHEVAACREPGALDGGTHILFAAHPRNLAD